MHIKYSQNYDTPTGYLIITGEYFICIYAQIPTRSDSQARKNIFSKKKNSNDDNFSKLNSKNSIKEKSQTKSASLLLVTEDGHRIT